jgi:hypothetical protein
MPHRNANARKIKIISNESNGKKFLLNLSSQFALTLFGRTVPLLGRNVC